jgi:carbonic anhydrase
VGSVEFAAEVFNTRLAVVLGHTQCGAVIATLDQLRRPKDATSPNLRSIVDRIAPAVEQLLANTEGDERILAAAVRANVRASVEQLRHGSSLLERRIAEDGLLIVGAEYQLETGEVLWY